MWIYHRGATKPKNSDVRAMLGRRLLAAVGFLAVAASGRTLEAQEPASGAPKRPLAYRFEASIMGGYRFLGDLTSAGEAPFQSVDLSNTPTWGVTLGYDLSQSLAIEAQYSYARPEATWIPRDPSQSSFQFEIGVRDFQLAGLLQVPIDDPDFLAYAGLGGGVTILDTSEAVGDTAKFSFSLSLGVKRYLSKHVGLRFEARWIPAYLWTSSEGVDICDVNDICFNTGNRYMQQLDFRGGATFRF
jgi:outer membrane protein with beta-barrel domain